MTKPQAVSVSLARNKQQMNNPQPEPRKLRPRSRMTSLVREFSCSPSTSQYLVTCLGRKAPLCSRMMQSLRPCLSTRCHLNIHGRNGVILAQRCTCLAPKRLLAAHIFMQLGREVDSCVFTSTLTTGLPTSAKAQKVRKRVYTVELHCD